MAYDKIAKVHRELHWGYTGDDVRALQNNLNDVVHHFDNLLHFKLPDTGNALKLTFGAAHRSAYILGLPQSRLDEIAGKSKEYQGHRVITERVQNLLRNPDERSKEQIKTGQERRERDRQRLRKQREQMKNLLIVEFDGHSCAGWIVRDALQPARKARVWGGVVLSGFRDPAYSEHLCIVMCGNPTCPGVCGGALSNHSCPPTHACVKYEGAVDVTDPAGLDRWCQQNNIPLIGNGRVLSRDVNHFSHNGN